MHYMKYQINIFILFLSLSLACNSFASISPSAHDWLIKQTKFSYQKINNNLSPSDGDQGVVLASSSHDHPNYYYHWVRDAGLVMDAMLQFYQHDASLDERQHIRVIFNHYIDFSIKIQNAPTLSDLGEPKFYVDGRPFNDPWARPQNDSPALRAISLIHWANILIQEGNIAEVKAKLYSARLPATLPIKKDLEYLSHHWKDASYDLWEEVKGVHFYTLMVIRRALIEGARLATLLKDNGAAQWYLQQAKEIEIKLQAFWDESRGYLTATIDRQAGINYKTSNLDSSVILGLLHGDLQDGFLSWNDKQVIKTIHYLIQKFAMLYPINHQKSIPGFAIGRYPEDKYAGTDFNGGNPWVVCTLGVAEALYRSAHAEKSIQIAQANEMLADQLVLRVKFHAYPDGSLSEQMHRDTGYMTSAENLTWNYAAIISTRFSS